MSGCSTGWCTGHCTRQASLAAAGWREQEARGQGSWWICTTAALCASTRHRTAWQHVSWQAQFCMHACLALSIRSCKAGRRFALPACSLLCMLHLSPDCQLYPATSRCRRAQLRVCLPPCRTAAATYADQLHQAIAAVQRDYGLPVAGSSRNVFTWRRRPDARAISDLMCKYIKEWDHNQVGGLERMAGARPG